jgi:CRP-like cAMP-binding protein
VHIQDHHTEYNWQEVPTGDQATEVVLKNGSFSHSILAKSAPQLSENRRRTNKILASMPNEDVMRLAAQLEPVSFTRHQEICDVENGDCYIHFPLDMVVSQLSIFADGSTAEVALIGNEGVVGLNYIFNSFSPERWTCIAVSGKAMRMRAKDLKREFDRGGALQQLLLGYTGYYVEQISRRAVCNSQHKIEERLASWLLMMHDRVGCDLLLTQEQISCRLGTRRSSITLAAASLQQQNIISYLRGRIRILNRNMLEMAACECYRTFSHENRKVVAE